MRPLYNNIKLIIVSLIVGLWVFVYPLNAFSGTYYRPIKALPKSDFKESAIGFGVAIAMPFVTYGIGQALGALGQAGTQTGTQAGTQAATQAAAQTSKLATIGQFLLNPSGLKGMQGIMTNMAIYHSASVVGNSLTKSGQLCWGMSPSQSQLLGMVGSSATTFGMGAITNPGGIAGIYAGGPKSIAKFAIKHPITTGVLTGTGFGALTSGISLGVQRGLKKSVSPGTASAIGSVTGNILGAGLWGGLTTGLTTGGAVARRSFAEGFTHALIGEPSWTTKSSEGVSQLTEGARQFAKEMALRSIDIGITYGAESSGMKPQYAGIVGSTSSMLIGNVSSLIAGSVRQADGSLKYEWDKANNSPWALRPIREITNEPIINAILEPAIHGTSAYAMNKWTEDIDEPYKVALTNMGTFLAAATVSSAIHTLTVDHKDYYFEEARAHGIDPQVGILPADMQRKLWKNPVTPEGRVAQPVSSQIFDYNVYSTGGPGKFFLKHLANRIYQFSRDTISLSPYTGQGLLVERGPKTDYKGALQLTKLWNFAGLSNFALQADSIRHPKREWGFKWKDKDKGWRGGWYLQKPYDKGGDWRAVDLLGNPFTAWTKRAGSMARYHTIQNMEWSGFCLTRAVKPYDTNKLKYTDVTSRINNRKEVKDEKKGLKVKLHDRAIYIPKDGPIWEETRARDVNILFTPSRPITQEATLLKAYLNRAIALDPSLPEYEFVDYVEPKIRPAPVQSPLKKNILLLSLRPAFKSTPDMAKRPEKDLSFNLYPKDRTLIFGTDSRPRTPKDIDISLSLDPAKAFEPSRTDYQPKVKELPDFDIDTSFNLYPKGFNAPLTTALQPKAMPTPLPRPQPTGKKFFKPGLNIPNDSFKPITPQPAVSAPTPQGAINYAHKVSEIQKQYEAKGLREYSFTVDDQKYSVTSQPKPGAPRSLEPQDPRYSTFSEKVKSVFAETGKTFYSEAFDDYKLTATKKQDGEIRIYEILTTPSATSQPRSTLISQPPLITQPSMPSIIQPAATQPAIQFPFKENELNQIKIYPSDVEGREREVTVYYFPSRHDDPKVIEAAQKFVDSGVLNKVPKERILFLLEGTEMDRYRSPEELSPGLGSGEKEILYRYARDLGVKIMPAFGECPVYSKQAEAEFLKRNPHFTRDDVLLSVMLTGPLCGFYFSQGSGGYHNVFGVSEEYLIDLYNSNVANYLGALTLTSRSDKVVTSILPDINREAAARLDNILKNSPDVNRVVFYTGYKHRDIVTGSKAYQNRLMPTPQPAIDNGN